MVEDGGANQNEKDNANDNDKQQGKGPWRRSASRFPSRGSEIDTFCAQGKGGGQKKTRRTKA